MLLKTDMHRLRITGGGGRSVHDLRERRIMEAVNKVLGFREEGLRGLHFFIKDLDYPIVAAEYSDRDTMAFRILNQNMKTSPMTSESICQWCISHRIYFTVLYGFRIKHFLVNPLKMWRYLQMRVRLKQFSDFAVPANE